MPASVETVRVPYPVGHDLQRWLEYVSNKGRVAFEWIVKGVRHYRGADTRWYFWKYETRKRVEDREARRAAEATAEAVKKREAAPTWDDLAHTFGEQGLERDATGKIVGYRYPKPKDDEQRRKINETVYEMWNPHRRIATEIGMEKSAAVEMTTLVSEATGQARAVPVAQAEKVAKKAGMVEKRKRARKSGRKA